LTPPLIAPLTASVDTFVDRKRGVSARVSYTHLQSVNGPRSKPTNYRVNRQTQTINAAINGHPHIPPPVDRKIECVGGGIRSNRHPDRMWRILGGHGRQRSATKTHDSVLALRVPASLDSSNNARRIRQKALLSRQQRSSARVCERETFNSSQKKGLT